MGCFSYICPKCGNPIYSDKYGTCEGEEVRLGRLVDHKIVEWMRGRYNSYGQVHTMAKINPSFISEHWINADSEQKKVLNEEGYHEWQTEKWGKMVDEFFNADPHTGLIAIHEKCWDGSWGDISSKDDPDQGWRDYENDEGERDEYL